MIERVKGEYNYLEIKESNVSKVKILEDMGYIDEKTIFLGAGVNESDLLRENSFTTKEFSSIFDIKYIEGISKLL